MRPSSRVWNADEGLVERLADKLVHDWHAGKRLRVEDLLVPHPELYDNPEAILELLSEELHLRQETGASASLAELMDRFPRWPSQVRALLECHELLAVSLASPHFPNVGEQMGEFEILDELGRGVSARVFLARQPELAGRYVVLKLTLAAGQEHLSLARLQHTHIVPLHSVHDFPERHLRGLCQPWYGGMPLDRLLAALPPPAERCGRHLVEALARLPSPDAPARRPALEFLARASFVEAVCWMGACLADALHYAHERGLLHLDVKASNVLLSADGQPMLLDFHLAREPLRQGQPAPISLGGTPGSMAPEQEAALSAVRRRQPVAADVEGRADVYALGLLLVDLLTEERDLDSSNIPFRLRALLRRCLEPSSRNRYPTAAAVAADLRRHLVDLPLRGVPNGGPLERLRRWRRRRPHALPLLAGLVLAITAGVFFMGHLVRQFDRGRRALREGQTHLERQHPDQAVASFRHGLTLVEDLPLSEGLREELRVHLQEAECIQAAAGLHELCERLRPLYDTASLPPQQAAELARQCERFLNPNDALDRLDRHVRTDLIDLAILTAHLRAVANPGATAHREALVLLDRVAERFGRNRVLELERSFHARALGLDGLAEEADRRGRELPAESAWDFCALGRSLLRAGELEPAAAAFDRALTLQPGALWANFYRGGCALRQGHADDALAYFSACVALAPECAWCYYNRGLAYEAADRHDRAASDFQAATDRGLDIPAVHRHLALSLAAKKQSGEITDR
jgi:eukaryotic-like serine/threonine-protein kinase